MKPVQVVWFKRDLRSVDHAPLFEAAREGPVLPLYVVEPSLWQQVDASGRQWQFCRESLLELRAALTRLGTPLVVRVGAVETVLERAHQQFGIAGLWSHEETGNGWTYARDQRVAAWARSHGIPWHEWPQFGVVRRLKSRNGWARRWQARMDEAVVPQPLRLTLSVPMDPGPVPNVGEVLDSQDHCPLRQRGGRAEGLLCLESFLQQRS
ncbi:MAG: deoxyribodipyrimidine photo-lyase, partial [Cyanobacteria bacterium K_DeepCast_35m_m2_023]|nr:deoxyribodipyrimidine photo-lyase [Cyanobacteria bacterium K_DeepCast_35m_m2_023]